MSKITTSNPPNDLILKRFRFSREDYHLLEKVGLLTEDSPVELINGEIIEMSPINSLHAGTVKRLLRFLSNALTDQYLIGAQDPIDLGEYSEPEPDLSILKYREDTYINSHPGATDILLLIEVADSSLEKDRTVKLPLYAQADIPETWIVNLQDKQIEVYGGPKDGTYHKQSIYQMGDILTHELIGELPVKDMLG